jgi:deoxyribonucleoside regulator
MDNNFLLAEIAKLYYIDKVKQKEIAERYQMTPMLVSRLLKRAEDKGIVTFYVKMPSEIDLDMGKKIKDKYKLRECIVLNINPEDNIKEKIGKFAAEYIEGLIGEDSIIGMSWGQTIYEFAKNLSYVNRQNCKVIQLAGGFMTESNYLVTPSNIIKMVSEKLNCIPMFLNAPFSISTEEAKVQLLEDQSNKYVMELGGKANINIIGTSELSEKSTMFEVGVLDISDRAEMLEKGAIGEIEGFPIDKDGNEITWSKSKLYTGVPLSVIKQAPNIICLSGEEQKAKVLAAGMKKKYFNILITSQAVAEKLIQTR